jgi:membrane-associated phospholipid phosphatase
MNLFVSRLLLVVIFFTGSLFLLSRHMYHLVGFLLGYVGCFLINLFLKWMFLQPRPSTDLAFFKVSVSREKNRNNPIWIMNYCAMPSGHAQFAGFALVYVILSTHSWRVWTFMTLLTLVTCVQRIVTQAHTLLQVLVGLLIGMVWGWICYATMMRFLKRASVQGVLPKS